MTTSYYPQEEDWYNGEWEFDHEGDGLYDERAAFPFDLIVLAAVVMIILALVAGYNTFASSRTVIEARPQDRQEETMPAQPAAPAAPAAPLPNLTGSEAFVMPYDEYILTQGPHGMSYGHFALDLASGAGEPILSPINGRISQYFIDGIGNPTLVIENDAYQVTMLHGRFTAQVGQEVSIGDQVGTESNLGNTRDMAGNSCRNRDCGYHTHLNVYSKLAGQNVNPLDLLN